MRSADGFLVVFDVSNRKTFGELPEFRKQIQRAKDNPFPCMVIVGNKCDLPDSEWDVAAEEAQALAKEWNVPYLEARYQLSIMHACTVPARLAPAVSLTLDFTLCSCCCFALSMPQRQIEEECR